MEEEKEIFVSILKDADLRQAFSSAWWVLKFENGSIIRVRDEVYSGGGMRWEVGKKYRVTNQIKAREYKAVLVE